MGETSKNEPRKGETSPDTPKAHEGTRSRPPAENPTETPAPAPDASTARSRARERKPAPPESLNPEAGAAEQPQFGKDQPDHYCGKKGRSGPPKGNRNNLRHGLTAGKLPAGCQYIENQLNGFRRRLEDIVLEVKGDISLTDAAAIQTALKWERHGALALRWLTKEEENLSMSDRLQFSREIARASTERDKALASLRLDRHGKDSLLDALYARTVPNLND